MQKYPHRIIIIVVFNGRSWLFSTCAFPSPQLIELSHKSSLETRILWLTHGRVQVHNCNCPLWIISFGGVEFVHRIICPTVVFIFSRNSFWLAVFTSTNEKCTLYVHRVLGLYPCDSFSKSKLIIYKHYLFGTLKIKIWHA